MSSTPQTENYKVADLGLAKQGRMKIEWAESRMPVLMALRGIPSNLAVEENATCPMSRFSPMPMASVATM